VGRGLCGTNDGLRWVTDGGIGWFVVDWKGLEITA